MIDESRVRHIAKLARLKLTDQEVAQFAVQLGQILEYVRQLEQVDTTGVEPLHHPIPLHDVTAADEPRESLSPEDSLRNAPQREGLFFRVPKVLDDAGGA